MTPNTQVTDKVTQMLGSQPSRIFPSPDGALGFTEQKIAFAGYNEQQTPALSCRADQIERYWPEASGKNTLLHIQDTNGQRWTVRLDDGDVAQVVAKLQEVSGIAPSADNES